MKRIDPNEKVLVLYGPRSSEWWSGPRNGDESEILVYDTGLQRVFYHHRAD